MSKGCLQCLGSNLHLKNKFGEGYSLRLNFNVEDLEKVKDFIEKTIPQAKLTEEFPGKKKNNIFSITFSSTNKKHKGNYVYQIPNQNFQVSKLFSDLIRNNTKYGITDFGLSQTSLDDVFLNIVRRDGFFFLLF